MQPVFQQVLQPVLQSVLQPVLQPVLLPGAGPGGAGRWQRQRGAVRGGLAGRLSPTLSRFRPLLARVPTIVSHLLEGERPAADLSRLRFCRSASAALPPEHLRGFERKFGLGVIETMGLTETVAPSCSNPLDPAQRKLGAVGRALGGEPRIIDAELRPPPAARWPDGRTCHPRTERDARRLQE